MMLCVKSLTSDTRAPTNGRNQRPRSEGMCRFSRLQFPVGNNQKEQAHSAGSALYLPLANICISTVEKLQLSSDSV